MLSALMGNIFFFVILHIQNAPSNFYLQFEVPIILYRASGCRNFYQLFPLFIMFCCLLILQMMILNIPVSLASIPHC
jgi:hypothetical protein